MTAIESDQNKCKLKEYFNSKLLSCEKNIKKYKNKNKKIKITYYSLITLSIAGRSIALIVSTIITPAIPPLVIPVLTGISSIATALSAKFGLEDKKNKINQKIKELNEIEEHIRYVNVCNGNLTKDKIDKIYIKFSHIK